MVKRSCVGAFLSAGLVFLAGCAASQVDTIQVSPATQSLVAGQTAQFTATGSVGHGTHPASTEDVTSLVTWTSSAPAVATISASGLATAVAAGSTTITATMPGFSGTISSAATLTVTAATTPGGGSTSTSIVSLSIIPGSQSVAAPNQTSQFIAIGTTSSGATQDMTNQAAWGSSSASIATITSTGLATGVSQGTATITAIVTNSDKSVATGTATFTIVSGASQPFTALAVTPTTESLSAGQVGHLIALGTAGATGLTEDLTNSSQVTWSSSIPSIASVSSYPSPAGLVTGLSSGQTTVTATYLNPVNNSVLTNSVLVTVSASAPPEPLLSLTIIPNSITVGSWQDTGQFLAIGTFSTAPYVRDLTNSVTWLSSFPDVFPVNTNSGGTSSASAGIVTAYGSGSATIIAEATGSDGTIQTATAQFNCPLTLPNPNGNPPTPGTCWEGDSGPLKTTLTVIGEGLNTTNWLVTAPSATGTPDVIHCGPGWAGNGGTGGSVCVGIYPINTVVTLTAPAQTGVAFGGWTNYCTPVLPVNAAGPNSCQISLGTTNATVGAIFNNQ